MEVVDNNGKVIISGVQLLRKTINVNKSVSIGCMNDGKNAVVSNERNITFAFSMSSTSNVNIQCIDFKQLSIISMYERSKVTVKNCTVSGGEKVVFQINVGISLYVAYSQFGNISGHVINDDDFKNDPWHGARR